jgi:class 3 adenylate cyclase
VTWQGRRRRDARVSALAGAGEVLVSQTVKDLVAGSGITFADRGVQELKGVPGEWRLYSIPSHPHSLSASSKITHSNRMARREASRVGRFAG